MILCSVSIRHNFLRRCPLRKVEGHELWTGVTETLTNADVFP